jgi:hypothetical protein
MRLGRNNKTNKRKTSNILETIKVSAPFACMTSKWGVKALKQFKTQRKLALSSIYMQVESAFSFVFIAVFIF